MSVHGKCLCGAVQFSAEPRQGTAGVCHCNMCRTWTAGPFLAIGCGDSVQVQGEENLGVYRSSNWGERCFCTHCGTPLFWRTVPDGHTGVSINALDEVLEGLALEHEIFIDEKPEWYGFLSESSKKMTGAEFISSLQNEGDA